MKYPRYAPLALGLWLVVIYFSGFETEYRFGLYLATGIGLILTYIYRTIVFYADHRDHSHHQPTQTPPQQ